MRQSGLFRRFLNGIEGKPDAERKKSFEEAIALARKLAKRRLTKDAREDAGCGNGIECRHDAQEAAYRVSEAA